jgi:hypothetical protein
MEPTNDVYDYRNETLLRRLVAENAELRELLDAGFEQGEVTDDWSPHWFGPDGDALVPRKPAADGR